MEEIRILKAVIWLSAWVAAYFAIGLVLAGKVIPKWHLAAMRKYVERQYDYHLRIAKEPGIPEALAAEYRKQMRECAANGDRLEKDLPKVPFSYWLVAWPVEIWACLRIESMAAGVRKRIRSWDAKRAT